MKRVKVMLSAILVMAIVAGALAFKVKTPGVCAYTSTITENIPATTVCNLTHTTTLSVQRKTVAGLDTQFASIIAAQEEGTPCPTTTIANCPVNKTLAAE